MLQGHRSDQDLRRPASAVDNASLSKWTQGSIVALHWPQWRGQDHLVFACVAGFLHDQTQGQVQFLGQDITGMKPRTDIARRGMVRTFQITQPFAKLSVLDNIMRWAPTSCTPMPCRCAAPMPLHHRRAGGHARCDARSARGRPDRGRPQAARTGPHAWPPTPSCCCSMR
jgi:hypothetical protein